MSERQTARWAFGAAAFFLLVSGISAYVTITRLLESQRWVFHTLQVQAALGAVDSAIARAGRLRAGYLYATGTVSHAEFDDAANEVYRRIQEVRALVEDSPYQRQLCDRLEKAASSRLDLFRTSIKTGTVSPEDDETQGRITAESAVYANEITSVMQEMRQREKQLLNQRVQHSGRLFTLAILILASTFIVALVFFSVNYRFLSSELRARRSAERAAHQSEQALRRLTARLLKLQDEERRKISRELHDSLGQYLAGVKMNLEMHSQKTDPSDHLLQDAVHLLDQSIAETRMISHLLHPPLLDETGLGSAAKWFIEGFARRSGIEVNADIPERVERLPEPLELALFRVLQESLTNIHRHAKSSKAEVQLRILPGSVRLNIRDFGKGIPREVLRSFNTVGTGTGVGLAGMRERIHELGGDFEIESGPGGTQIAVNMPLAEQAKAAEAVR